MSNYIHGAYGKPKGINTTQRIVGKSAYEIAVDHGFVGSEEEWLESLKGKSAYEVAVDLGYEGTADEWVESIGMAMGIDLVDELTDLKDDLNEKAPAIFESITGTSNIVENARALSVGGPTSFSLSLFDGDDIIYPSAQKKYNTYGLQGVSYVAPNKLLISGEFPAEKNAAISTTGNDWNITLSEPISSGSTLKFRIYWISGTYTGNRPNFTIAVNGSAVKYNLSFDENTLVASYDYTASAEVTSIRIIAKIFKDSTLTDALIGFACTTATHETVIPAFNASSYDVPLSSVDGWDSVCSMPVSNTVTKISDTKTYVDNHVPNDVWTWTLSPYVTPEMYEAVGDGDADDTNAVNAAIAYGIQHNVPVIGTKKYKITSTIDINTNDLRLYLVSLVTAFNGYAVKYKGQRSKITIDSIYSTVGGGVFVTAANGVYTQNNEFNFQRIYVQGLDALRLECEDGQGIYYNIFRVTMLRSATANALSIIYGYGENKFYGGKLSSRDAWAIYINTSSFNKFYGFSMEGDCFAGIKLENTSHNEFLAFRDIELIMQRINAPEGSDKGLALKFIGESLSNKYETMDSMYFQAIDISQCKTPSEYSTADSYLIVSTAKTNIVKSCDIHSQRQFTTIPRGYVWGIPSMLIHDLLVFVNRIVALVENRRAVEITETSIDLTDFNVTYLKYGFPSIFNISQDCIIKLSSSYCNVGIKDILVNQLNGNRATIVDWKGYTIFDGASHGDGSYTVSAYSDVDNVYLGPIGKTDSYIPGWYNGENDVWHVNGGTHKEVTHLQPQYLEVSDTKQLNTVLVAPTGWQSSDTSVATILNGVVTAVANGTAVITITNDADDIERWTIDVRDLPD